VSCEKDLKFDREPVGSYILGRLFVCLFFVGVQGINQNQPSPPSDDYDEARVDADAVDAVSGLVPGRILTDQTEMREGFSDDQAGKGEASSEKSIIKFSSHAMTALQCKQQSLR